MHFAMFGSFIMGISFSLLISMTRASPLLSDLHDVTSPNSQSETLVSEISQSPSEMSEETTTHDGIAETTHVSSSQSVFAGDNDDDSADEGISQRTDSQDNDLLSAGQNVVDQMSFTIAQTNYTFKQLCSQWCSARSLDDTDSRCAAIAQTGPNVSPLPTFKDVFGATANKNVYTSLLAVYNVTYQYQHLLHVAATTMQCAGCTGSTVCDDVDSMTISTPEDFEHFTYCNYMNLYHNFEYQSRTLFEMMKRFRKDTPVIEPVSLPNIEDPTEREEVTLATIATAATQLAEAKTIMQISVVDQL